MNNSGVYTGVVRGFDSVSKEARVVVPQLFDYEPVDCQPLVKRQDELAFVAAPKVGDVVLVLWDGGKTNAKPKWMFGEVGVGDHWNSAWGVVAMGNTTDDVIALSGGSGTVLTTVITFKPLIGRRYRLKYQVRAIGSPGSTSCHVDLWIDGAYLPLSDSWYEGEITYGGRTFEWIIAADGVQHTYQLRGVGSTGHFFHHQNDAGNAYFYLEDIGPVAGVTPTPEPPIGSSWGSHNLPGMTVTQAWADWPDSVRTVSWPVGREINLLGHFTGFFQNFFADNMVPVTYRLAASFDGGVTWTNGPSTETTPIAQISPFVNRAAAVASWKFTGTPTGEVRLKVQAIDTLHTSSTTQGGSACLSWWAS